MISNVTKDFNFSVSDYLISTPPNFSMDKFKADMTEANKNPSFDLEYFKDDIEKSLSVKNLSRARYTQGFFGCVYKSQDCDSSNKCAIKILSARYKGPHFMEHWTRKSKLELYHLKRLQHDHIVAYLDHCWLSHDLSHLVIKTEWIDATLEDILVALNGPMDLVWFDALFVQISSALLYMHDKMGVAHHDIKAANIMLTRVKSLTDVEELKSDLANCPNWKVIDFGFAHKYSTPKVTTKESKFFLGTLLYKCPAKKAVRPYNPYLSDSYAFGMILWQAILGIENVFRKPFCDLPHYPKNLPPVWTICNETIWPRLKRAGVNIGRHHLVARKLVAPERERIHVSQALEMYSKCM